LRLTWSNSNGYNVYVRLLPSHNPLAIPPAHSSSRINLAINFFIQSSTQVGFLNVTTIKQHPTSPFIKSLLHSTELSALSLMMDLLIDYVMRLIWIDFRLTSFPFCLTLNILGLFLFMHAVVFHCRLKCIFYRICWLTKLKLKSPK